MIRPPRISTVVAVLAFASIAGSARAQGAEVTRTVEGGGITVKGWAGAVDANEAKNGMTIANARFVAEGKGFHVTTGPSATYWNPANTASGNYTVKATFTEPKYQNLNDHPHPYGIAIGGNDLGTDKATLLYCTAYGNGTFIVRGFGPAPFRLGGRGATAHDAVHKATAKGEPVTQEIAVSVKDGKVSCAINGTVVASFDKAETVGEGKLKSLDGVAGLRFGHNTEVVVSGFEVKKN
ncbi:MAG TPA: hypothetical protein VGJ96_03950 [Gemmatimonadaceae bacterium]|jgi:hypothetical protein